MEKSLIVLDFDGTIADYSNREPLRDINWDEYINQSVNDTPCFQMLEIIERFKGDYEIMILSARGEKCRQETTEWLDIYDVYYDKLELKPEGFVGEDWQFKEDKLKEILKTRNIFMSFDDRPSCVRAMRNIGIYTLQCGDGY